MWIIVGPHLVYPAATLSLTDFRFVFMSGFVYLPLVCS